MMKTLLYKISAAMILIMMILPASFGTASASYGNPEFTDAGDVTVYAIGGAYNASWATIIDDGGSGSDTVDFAITYVSGEGLFVTDPDIDASGTLTFDPTGSIGGSATYDVTLTNTITNDVSSPAHSLTITVIPEFVTISGTISQDSAFGNLPTGLTVSCWDDITDPNNDVTYGVGGEVDPLTGKYLITDVPGGTSCDVAPDSWSGGYTFYNDVDEEFTHFDTLVNDQTVDFTAYGTRSISGVITSPTGMRLPYGLSMNFGKGVVFDGYDNNIGATTSFKIDGLPPKNYMLRLTTPNTFDLNDCGASNYGLCSYAPYTDDNGDLAMPVLGSRFYPKPAAPAVIPLIPPTTAPNMTVASTLYGDDAFGNDLVYYPKTFTVTGSIKAFNPANDGLVLPALKVFNIALNGVYDDPVDGMYQTGSDFRGQSISGVANVTYNATTSAFSIKVPALAKQTAGAHATANDPAPFASNLVVSGVGYQSLDFDYYFNSVVSESGADVTAYGDRAVFGDLSGDELPDDTVISFGGGLDAIVEDNSFALAPLERKAYTLVPTADGYLFTPSATNFTLASLPVTLGTADFDVTGKLYAWRMPKPVSPANNANNPSGDWQAPTVEWEGVAGATTYQVQYSNSATFANAPTIYNTPDPTDLTGFHDSGDIDASVFFGNGSYSPSSLSWITPNMVVYWRVRFSEDNGTTWSEWTSKFPSLARSFKAQQSAPVATSFDFSYDFVLDKNLPNFAWDEALSYPVGAKYKVEYRKVGAPAWTVVPGTALAGDGGYLVGPFIPDNLTPVFYEFRVTLLNSGGVAISPASDPVMTTIEH